MAFDSKKKCHRHWWEYPTRPQNQTETGDIRKTAILRRTITHTDTSGFATGTTGELPRFLAEQYTPQQPRQSHLPVRAHCSTQEELQPQHWTTWANSCHTPEPCRRTTLRSSRPAHVHNLKATTQLPYCSHMGGLVVNLDVAQQPLVRAHPCVPQQSWGSRRQLQV